MGKAIDMGPYSIREKEQTMFLKFITIINQVDQRNSDDVTVK